MFDVPATAASSVNHRVRLYDSGVAPAAHEAPDAGETLVTSAIADPGVYGGARGGEVEDGTASQVSCIAETIAIDIALVRARFG